MDSKNNAGARKRQELLDQAFKIGGQAAVVELMNLWEESDTRLRIMSNDCHSQMVKGCNSQGKYVSKDY